MSRLTRAIHRHHTEPGQVCSPRTPFHTIYDGHGSVRGLTDSSANLTDTYAYDAFGTIIEQTGTTPNNYLYAGEQFDPDLGFYYNRARYLNVETGRFWSMDTYSGANLAPTSLHKYLYGNNDPVSHTDPTGNWSISELLSTVGINGILNTLATGAIKGAIWGAAIGGVDAYYRGDDIIEGAKDGAVMGASIGSLATFRFLAPVIVAGGLALGTAGVFDAINSGNIQLAIFRSIVLYAGWRTFAFPTPEVAPVPQTQPTLRGRFGNAQTRDLNEACARYLEARGWTIEHVGSRGSEEYLPPLGGGRKGGNYVDLTATKSGKTLRVNTIDTLADNVTPTVRENAAAALIGAKRPNDTLVLIPKETSHGDLSDFLSGH